MSRPFIKTAVVPGVELDEATLEIVISAHPVTLRELQTIILIEANQKGIPHVPQNAEV